ncbi:cryptochrome/photolyase family protein, partial [Gammaproteobacteria bacterium]|nr:cryptochrome/photolyase family protein [Gammaproteobacteria bacterium]
MSSIGLIFPDQLSLNNEVLEAIQDNDQILLYEPIETFYEISHHKHKLVFLISAFRHFKELLKHHNLIHVKIEKERSLSLINYLDSLHEKSPFSNLYVSKPSDFKTLKDLMYFCQSHEIKLKVFDDKKFISTIEDFNAWSEGKKTTIQEYYYRWLRKKFNILMDDDGKPLGEKWNFDKENRKGISQLKVEVPQRNKIKTDSITVEVMIEIEDIFNSSPGDLENFNWAVTHEHAWNLFLEFLEIYLPNYGSFQDAINKDDPFMYHSLLSPYFNAGLLDPMECIKSAENKYKESNGAIPINSVEGFIRQILGWREFIMGVYWDNMPQYKQANFWSHSKNLTDSWYKGSTGIPPLDTAIIESNNLGYTHHINRLMIISNLMNLS